jgi:hypothetical protein
MLFREQDTGVYRSQIQETEFTLPGLKSHFLPSRFLRGSRAWKFRERFG